jgi:chromosome segregation ATPase
MKEELDKKLTELVGRLQQERDELRVRAHQLKAELRDEWDEVESKWGKIEPRLEHLAKGGKDSADDIGAAVSQVGEEIAHAYRRIRDALK